MSVDAELEAWRQEWRSEVAVRPDLASKVRRQSLYMRMMLVTEVFITLLIGGFAIAWAVQSLQADVVALAVAVWVFLGTAWTFGLKNRKGCRAPAAMNTSAFLDVSIRRCRAGVASAAFGTVLYFCELVFCTTWVYRHKSHATSIGLWAFLTSPVLILVWACTVAFIVAVVWYRRRKVSELLYLQKLRSTDVAEAVPPDEALSSVSPDLQRTSRVFSRLRARRRKGFGRV